MEQYTITGMSCAACSTRVEKAVSKLPGVTSCSVSLLTNSMGVEGSTSEQEIIAAVEAAGYGASKKGKEKENQTKGSKSDEDALSGKQEVSALRNRLTVSVIFLLLLMYLSMGHMMWNWKLPGFLEGNHVAMGLIQLLLTGIIMVINQKFFVSGWKSLLHGAPNMDTLVAMGAGAAFLYSTYALFAMTDAQVKGDAAAVMKYMHEFYFESAAMILTLITVGKMLEAYSKGRTTDALRGLIKLAPRTAVLLVGGKEKEVPIEQVKKGDLFIVRPGENIPVDGIVIEGNSAVNEAALTGESIPADKTAGDSVSAATINQTGFLKCQATRVGEDTMLSQIIRMVSDAAATKAPIAKTADKVSGVFVPTVIVIALITTAVWLLAGESIGFALARGISVLVISCPCALGLATPVAIMVGSGVGAKSGILFKSAAALEAAGRTEMIALDKTGTITSGEPQVTDYVPTDGTGELELLQAAYTLERKSEHPLAKAILKMGEEKYLALEEVADFQIYAGNGLSARLGQNLLTGGKEAFITQYAGIPDRIHKRAEELAQMGKTPLYFAKDDRLLGVIAVADVLKDDSAQAVSELSGMGIEVVMLTGDHEKTAQAIGAQAGVDRVIAGVLPDGKESVIRSLKEQGKTAMVGDGINDAPALTRADVGIAIGAGTDIAIDAAQIVLMKSRLRDVPAAIRLSRATLRNIHENLFWAFFYNVIGIPLAAGVWIPVFGWTLNPMFGAAAMSLSSFCVVTNALRLNFVSLYDAKHDRKGVNKKRRIQAKGPKALAEDNETDGNKMTEAVNAAKIEREDKKMEKTLKIEGMMCGHCEARVKKCLEELPGVESAVVSHESGTAVVTMTQEIDNAVFKKAIEEQGYQLCE